MGALGHKRAHVFGTSLGGVIAQVLAARHPARIDRLVLSSTFRVGAPLMSINPEGFPKFAELRSRLPDTIREFAEYFFPRDYITSHPEALGIFTGNKRDAGQRQRRRAILSHPSETELRPATAQRLAFVAGEY